MAEVDEEHLSALRARVEAAKAAYYDSGESGMADDEYDAAVRLLREHGVRTDERHVAEGTPWQKRRHARPMGSMPDQLRSDEEVGEFFGNTPVDLTFKYDGLSLELVYEDARLVAAVLRGDGEQGEDVLANARHVERVLPRLACPSKGTVAVYGELVISWNNLAALNEMRELDGLEPYKTPRNAVSMVRSFRLAQPGPRMALMTFKAFDVHPRPEGITQVGVVHELQRLGFIHAVAFQRVPAAEAWEKLGRLDERVQAGTIQYQVDGLVARDSTDFDRVAKLKLPPRAAVATVVEVADSLGRTGVVSPLVVIEPVVLGGVTVTRVTGHNRELIARDLAGLGPGATVLVSRRGDVIPHVERVIQPSPTPWVPPTKCPSCEGDLVEAGAYLRCSSDPSDCSGTSVGLMVKYARSMGIEGLGPSIAQSLVASGLATEPAHLYSLDPAELAALPTANGQLGEKLARRLVDSIYLRSRCTLGQLLGAVGVRGCATSVMEAVAAAFPEDSVLHAEPGALAAVDGVGPVRAAAIREFVLARGHVISDLLAAVSVVRAAGPLEGKTFCVTMGTSVPREQLESAIRAAGGGVKSSVSKKVTHLVCNQPDAGTSKLKRAAELGVPVISEAGLRAMIGDAPPEPEPSPDEQF